MCLHIHTRRSCPCIYVTVTVKIAGLIETYPMVRVALSPSTPFSRLLAHLGVSWGQVVSPSSASGQSKIHTEEGSYGRNVYVFRKRF